jgi:hypothetical protein
MTHLTENTRDIGYDSFNSLVFKGLFRFCPLAHSGFGRPPAVLDPSLGPAPTQLTLSPVLCSLLPYQDGKVPSLLRVFHQRPFVFNHSLASSIQTSLTLQHVTTGLWPRQGFDFRIDFQFLNRQSSINNRRCTGSFLGFVFRATSVLKHLLGLF